MTHCAVSRLCCVLLKFRFRTSPFSGQDSVRRNMYSAVGRTWKKYHVSLTSPLQWGQFTEAISNVLLLFWKCYHCKILPYVSRIVMEGQGISNLLFTFISG